MGHPLSFRVKNKAAMTITENSATNAWNLNFSNGNQNNNNKSTNQNRVRAVSAYNREGTSIFLIINNKIERIIMITDESMFEACYDCRKRKRSTANAIAYEVDFESRLISLVRSINERTYMPSRSITFVVTRPRYREVFAADFSDRICHHWIVLRLEPLLEKVFNDRTFNCRKGKGTLYGVNQLKADIKACSENFTKDCYIATADMQGFFMSIPKELLADVIDDFIVRYYFGNDKEDLRWLTRLLIMHRPELFCIVKSPESMWDRFPHTKSLRFGDGTKGMPIGNLISQIFANFFLNGFDWYLENTLGFKYHGRYVDDFYIIDTDKQKILDTMPKIRAYLANIGITLHPHKFYLQHYSKGVRFVGSVVKFDRSYILNRTVEGLKRSIHIISKSKTLTELEHNVASANSYFGFMRHHNTYAIRRNILAKAAPEFWKYCTVKGRMESVRIKRRYRKDVIRAEAMAKGDYEHDFSLSLAE